MPFYRIKTYYYAFSENKLEIMHYFVGKLIKKGWRVRAVNIWLSTLVDLKQLSLKLPSKKNFILQLVEKHKAVIMVDHYNSADYYKFRVNVLKRIPTLQFFLISTLLSYTELNPVDYIIFMALENVCPMAVFTKEQKARNLFFIPIYAKHRRNIKFGVSWILLTARINSKHISMFPQKISMEIWKAANNSPDSVALQLKAHYTSLARRNLRLVKVRVYF